MKPSRHTSNNQPKRNSTSTDFDAIDAICTPSLRNIMISPKNTWLVATLGGCRSRLSIAEQDLCLNFTTPQSSDAVGVTRLAYDHVPHATTRAFNFAVCPLSLCTSHQMRIRGQDHIDLAHLSSKCIVVSA